MLFFVSSYLDGRGKKIDDVEWCIIAANTVDKIWPKQAAF